MTIANLHPALAYAAKGWHVFPVKPHAKEPLTTNGFKDATTDPAKINAWLSQWPNANWAIATGPSGLLVIDVDPKNGGDVSWNELVDVHGPSLVDSVRVRTGGDGLHVYFQRPPANGHGDLGNTVSHIAPGIDTRGAGGYVVAPPSIHPNGKPYTWATDHAFNDVDVKPLPKPLLELLQKPKTTQGTVLVPEVIADGKRNDTIFRMAAGLQRKGYTPGGMLALLREENRVRCKPPLSESELQAIVRQATKYEGGPIPDVLVDAELTDVGNGERLCALYGHKFRHVEEWGWLVWDGRCWARDSRGYMEALAKRTVDATRQAAERLKGEENDDRRKALRSWVKKSQSISKLRDMIAAARSEDGVDRTMDEFDTKDGLLNVRNGVVDLATGEVMPHDPELGFTAFTNIDYDPKASCRRWDDLVLNMAADNLELVGYLQRAAGYTLTGYTNEQKLFFLYGAGANGKTTFVEVLGKLLGRLATPVGFDALLNSRDSKPGHTMAALVGRRMAMATEAPEGRSFNEEMLKAGTGGDTVVAKLLYKDEFAMTPRFKLWLTGNNRPTIRGITPGTWRRFELVPCLRSVPEHKRVKNLKELLLQELAGILAWAVRGAVEWHKLGLQTPKSIRDAVEEYRLENDIVGRWLDECCTIREDLKMPAGEGLRAINEWLRTGHEPEMTAAMFGRRMAAWNNEVLKRHKGGDGLVVWLGVGLGRNVPPPGKQGTLEATSTPKAGGVPPTAAQHDRMTFLLELVRRIAKASERQLARLQDLMAEVYAYGWTEELLERDLRVLVQNSALYSKGGAGTWAPVNP